MLLCITVQSENVSRYGSYLIKRSMKSSLHRRINVHAPSADQVFDSRTENFIRRIFLVDFTFLWRWFNENGLRVIINFFPSYFKLTKRATDFI